MSIIKKGDKYNRLTAVKFICKRGGAKYWLFKCDCGNEKIIYVGNVKKEKSKSCGCLNIELIKKRSIKHKMCDTRTYKSWTGMKSRCLNKNNPAYKCYGGRRIKICKEWLKSFENFYRDMGECPKNKTIDRIDNNGNYCKENCRWATWEEQQNNRRNNHFLTYKNKTQTLAQWIKELKISRKKLYKLERNILTN